MLKPLFIAFLALVTVCASNRASAQAGPSPEVRMAAQREAMARLAFLDGAWEGTARVEWIPGEVRKLHQTERIGPFLGGAIKLIEGHGYAPDGTLEFNAFAIVSYDVDRAAYRIRSYSQGYAGDYEFTPAEDGFVWTIPAGEDTVRFAAEIAGDRWTQTGDRVRPDGRSPHFIEMELFRTGQADWQAGDTK